MCVNFGKGPEQIQRSFEFFTSENYPKFQRPGFSPCPAV